MVAVKRGLPKEDLLESANGGPYHHKPRLDPKPDWTDVDPEDGSSGVTYTW